MEQLPTGPKLLKTKKPPPANIASLTSLETWPRERECSKYDGPTGGGLECLFLAVYY